MYCMRKSTIPHKKTTKCEQSRASDQDRKSSEKKIRNDRKMSNANSKLNVLLKCVKQLLCSLTHSFIFNYSVCAVFYLCLCNTFSTFPQIFFFPPKSLFLVAAFFVLSMLLLFVLLLPLLLPLLLRRFWSLYLLLLLHISFNKHTQREGKNNSEHQLLLCSQSNSPQTIIIFIHFIKYAFIVSQQFCFIYLLF